MANDFSDAKALWRFEPGALDTDSVGSNTLADRYSYYDPCAEATAAGLYKEGSGAVQTRDPSGVGTIQWKRIIDADLDAGFPTKYGDTTIKISVACWFRYTEDQDLGAADMRVIAKYSDSSSQRVFEFGTNLDGSEWYLGTYYGVSSLKQNIYTSGAGLEHGVWYHVGLALDGVNKTYLIRSYNASTDTAQTFSGSLTNAMRTGEGYIDVGRGHDGYLDEMAIFAGLKTADDFDDMRDGVYIAPPTNLLDGKLTVYHVTDLLDGRARVYESDRLDGKVAVNTPTGMIDGLVVVRSAAFGLLDGLLDLPLMVRTFAGAWRMVPPASQWALPVAEPRRDIFVCVLRATGLADYEVPMSSLQMRRRDGYPTMVSCVVPDAMTYLAGAQARVDGELIIMAGSVTADGTRHLSELDRATLESISYDHGVRSSSLSLSGYRTATTGNPRPVDLTHLSYYGLQADGKRRVRGPINQFVRPGDTAIFGAESMVVDQIFVAVEPGNAWMEVAGL